jgi:hypothetical protein
MTHPIIKVSHQRLLGIFAAATVAITAAGPGTHLAKADTFAGRADFGSADEFERRAAWGQADAGACRILSPTITIRRDGTASFSGSVASTNGNDAYCVILDFFDRNQVKLFHFPMICSQTLTSTFNNWTNPNLAIPPQHFPFIVFATREDHC